MRKPFRLSDCTFSNELRYRQVLRGIGVFGVITLLVTAKLQENGHLVSVDSSALQSLFAHSNPTLSSNVSTYTASHAVAVSSINNLLEGNKTEPTVNATAATVQAPTLFQSAQQSSLKLTHLPLTWSVINATIKHSFTRTAMQAGLTSAEVSRIKALLINQIDFNHFKPNDQLKVLVARDTSGQSVKALRNILAIEISQDKTHLSVFQFKDKSGTISYYQANGHSLNPGFLRVPTHTIGVGSGFSTNRLDPITGHYHSHPAVDFRAPMGTPIVATGPGRINFMASETGYGNVVKITHAGQITTLYAHMKGFAKGLHKGSLVKTGQVIGYVGMTGYTTGPHVHYEFRVKGVPYNALTVKLPSATPLTGAAKKAFLKQMSVYQQYL